MSQRKFLVQSAAVETVRGFDIAFGTVGEVIFGASKSVVEQEALQHETLRTSVGNVPPLSRNHADVSV